MASQYSTILTSDSSTTVNQYDVIKYSDYENLKTKYETALSNLQSKYDTLYNKVYSVPSSFYNLRVEGGGIIFFDWKYGFTSTTPENGDTYSYALRITADTTSDLGDYYYNKITGTVQCSRVGDKHRFYVVAESDLTGSVVAWDATAPSTSRGTSTGFGTGKANTTLLCNAITNDMWPLVKTARSVNPGGHDLVSDDSALDTRWFVPSRDESCTISNMQHPDSSHRPSGIPQLSISYSAGTMKETYWTSSEDPSTSSFIRLMALDSDGYGVSGSSSTFKSSTEYVRLCRTF